MKVLALAPGLALLLAAGAPRDAPQDAPQDAPGPPGAPMPAGPGLPPGPAAEALAGLRADTPAAFDLPPVPHDPADPAWDTAAPWELWTDLVRREAAGEALAPREHATLAQLALGQGRALDAWAHLARCGEEPALVAALLPRFLPGAPADAPAGAGGLPAPLPDGVVLRPALPPPTPGHPRHQVDRRAMTLEGLRVGDAVLALRVSVESDGVQVDVEHRSGGAARLAIALPVPPDLEMRVEYVDWMRQDTVGEPLALAVEPGDEPHTLWGRFVSRPAAWPTSLPGELGAQLETDGLVVVHAPDEPRPARLEHAAAALGRLFGIPAAVRAEGAPRDADRGAPVDLDLARAADRERKLAALLSLAERFALRPPSGS